MRLRYCVYVLPWVLLSWAPPAVAELRLTCDALGAEAIEPPATKPKKGAPHRSGTHNFRKLTALGEYMRASGSGEFSEEGLARLLSDEALLGKAGKITIVDLRKETHGFVRLSAPTATAIAFSVRGEGRDEEGRLGHYNWLNAGQDDRQVPHGEDTYLKALSGTVTLHDDGRCNGLLAQGNRFSVAQAEDEAALVAAVAARLHKEASYRRFPVLDHAPPDEDRIIDEFAALVSQASADGSWLHVHCREGMGRTTTFLTLYDMLLNAQQPGMTADRIIHRQGFRSQGGVGGQNLFVIEGKRDTPTGAPAVVRERFLRNFFDYCRSRDNISVDAQTHRMRILRPWSRWVQATTRLQAISKAQAVQWANIGRSKGEQEVDEP